MVIDCPPALNMLTVNGFAAADAVIIPMQCEYYALEGLSDLVGTLRKVKQNLNPRIEIEALVRTMYDPRSTLTMQVSDELKRHYGDKVFDTVIPRNVRIAEAPSFGKPVLLHDPASKGAIAHLQFARELLERNGIAVAEAACMASHKGLGRGLDALLGGAAQRAARGRSDLAQLAVDGAPARQVPAAHAHGRGLARRARRVDQGARRDPADRGALGGRRRSTRSSPASAAGARRSSRGSPTCRRSCARCPTRPRSASALIENIQREDLNPIEEASGLKRLIDEFQLTHEEVARAIGRSRAGVTNLLRLLELAPAVQAIVQDGRIDMGHARALLAVSRARQVELAHQIAEKGLSVREAERLVQEKSATPRATAGRGVKLDADARRLEEELAETLGASVHLKPRRGGRGSVVIDYGSLDELEGLIGRLRRR